MTYQELVTEIKQLPPIEQKELLYFLIEMVNEPFSQQMSQVSSIDRVRGMLKPDRELLTTDEEMAEDYEDAVQYASAVTSQLEAIITRDPKDFFGATLPILSPIEFLKQLSSS